MDWDAFYQQDTPPPWSIGQPQPALAELIERGLVHSEVLDAGCGHAELSLDLAARGYTVVGLDFSPTAVAAAAAAATARGLTSATFAQADITDFGGYDGRFATVMDSGLFHSLPVDQRQSYLRCIFRAAAPGASLFILSFAAQVTDAVDRPGPRGVTEEEFRDEVSRQWIVDEVRPAALQAKVVDLPAPVAQARQWEQFVNGDHMTMPGFLLSAHKR
jgi:SAM-dependent methyltransferase